jgi:Rab3 GTPase-activating protein catalytic subunit
MVSLYLMKEIKKSWTYFISALRDHWESNQLIYFGKKNDLNPELTTCLLEQKIQMLNCCIKQSISIENTNKLDENFNWGSGWETPINLDEKESKFDKTSENSDEVSQNSEEENDDEFFEIEDVGSMDGVLKVLDGFYSNSGKPIYIPITQKSPPVTEDMILHQQEIFQSLGTSNESTQIRAKLQSVSLLSDME